MTTAACPPCISILGDEVRDFDRVGTIGNQRTGGSLSRQAHGECADMVVRISTCFGVIVQRLVHTETRSSICFCAERRDIESCFDLNQPRTKIGLEVYRRQTGAWRGWFVTTCHSVDSHLLFRGWKLFSRQHRNTS